MNASYRELFRRLVIVRPPATLRRIILARVRAIERRLNRWRLVGFGALAMGAVAGIIPAINYLAGAFGQSGFYQYFTLAFSDSRVLTNYGQEFGLSLLESLPLWGLVALLGAITLLLWSLPQATRAARMLAL